MSSSRLSQPVARPSKVGDATPAEIDADRISCEAGLGGSTPEDEMRVFPDFLRKIRKRMAPWGVTIPLFDHPRLGRV